MPGQPISRSPPLLVAVALTFVATTAGAQPARDVKLPALEASIGLTVNGLAQDVNSVPHCLNLALPCTHSTPSRFSGFGVNVSLSRNLSNRLAIAGDVSTFAAAWDGRVAAGAPRRAVAHATSVVVGPRVSTGFFYPGNGDRTPGRFFGHILAGGEASDVAPLRPALLVGGGSDVIIPWGGESDGSPHSVTLRMGLDYRLTPGGERNLSGWRFVLGFVLGPRVSRP